MRLPANRLLRTAAFGLALVACSSERTLGPSVAPASGAFDLTAAGGAMPSVRVAEFHYDNPGTDANERIEISGPAGTDLTGWSIVRYNGVNPAAGVTYASPGNPTVGGVIPATCGTRGVIVISYPQDGLQNGSNDGFALVNASNQVVEFLSYEGTMVASNGPAAGLTSTDVGVAETGLAAAPNPSSIQRQPDGSWILATGAAVNFGTCNDDNSGITPPPQVVSSVVVSPASATVNQGGTQQYTATAFDASNNAIPGTSFTWTTSDNTIATVNASGLATGVAAGDAIITASASGKSGTGGLHVNANAPYTPPNIRFSEIHYDNVGTDVGEAIEVEGPINTVLSNWSIVLYDGNGGTVYNTVAVNGTLSGTCNTRGVISIPIAGIQNGSPDGMALVDNNGVLVEFLSYEGTMTGTAGVANGVTSRDILVAEAGTEAAGMSLQRSANGTTWTGPSANTLGNVNACGGGTPVGNTITFSGRSPTSDPALPVGFEGQIFATEKSGSATVNTTFTWSSDTPAIASIDQNGVFHSLSAGTAVLRATATDGTTATYSLPMSVGTQSSVNYQGNTEFGDPAHANNTNDFIIRRAEYTTSYNKTLGHPNWVSLRLDATNYGIQDRCNCFTFDPELDAAGFPHLTTNDYTGAGAFAGFGIDRGHMARSADRTASDLDNAHTYFFGNVIPQAAAVNQGPWADEETYLGNFAKAGKEVYVVSGGAGSLGTLKGEGKIDMPAKVWKVAVIMDAGKGLADVHSVNDLTVIAVIMPNDASVNTDWTVYKTTVDAVEALSGYDLLSALPDNIENAVEANDTPPVARVTGPSNGLEGSAVTFDASASSDADAGDVLTYSWTFGDGRTGTGATPSHTFADNGTYTVTVTATDSHNVTSSASTTITIANVAPTGVISAPSVFEGSAYTVSFSSVNEPSSVDATSLSYQFDCGDGAGFHTSSTASYTCASVPDDAVRTVRATVTDKDGGTNTYSTNVTIMNAAPVITSLTSTAAPVSTGVFASVTANYTDAGVNDIQGITVDWGDGSTTTEAARAGNQRKTSHKYANAGFYTITVTITDNNGGVSAPQTTGAIVYSPTSSLLADGTVQGPTSSARVRANLSYANGAVRGTFRITQSLDLPEFNADAYDYLVISGNQSTVRGTGTLKDGRSVGFLATGIDGSSDVVRIKVWSLSDGSVLFDTQPGAADNATPATAVTGYYNIQSH